MCPRPGPSSNMIVRKRLLGWRIPFTTKVVNTDSPIYFPDGYYVTIPAHNTHSLSFTEQNHFDWGRDLKEDIYLRLWLIGRSSPIWIWVTGPKNLSCGTWAIINAMAARWKKPMIGQLTLTLGLGAVVALIAWAIVHMAARIERQRAGRHLGKYGPPKTPDF
jgi:hypothetical protein